MKALAVVVPGLCFLAVAAVANQASAYTINTTEVGKRIRWSSDSVSMQLDPALEEFMPDGEARTSLGIAFGAWRGLSRVPEIVLRKDAPTQKPGNHGNHPSNGVYLLEDWPYEPEKLAITVITYEMDTGRLLDADVLVNGETKFALLDEHAKEKTHEAYDLAAVLTHETGHVLGLGESPDAPDATMYPYAVPGETQKRTLATDDETGVITSYLGKPPAHAASCGSSSVAGQSNQRGGLFTLALAFSAIALCGSRRRSWRKVASAAPVAAVALLVGFGEPVHTNDPAEQMRSRLRAIEDLAAGDAQLTLRQALHAGDPEARLLAVEALARTGSRDDRASLEQLTSDDDERIAARASQALGMLLSRAPRSVQGAQTVEARARLARLFGRGSDAIAGRARRTGTVSDDGLLFTEYRVRDEAGREATLRVAGGTLGAIGQRALDGEPPPADDQELVVVPQPSGRTRWAYRSGDRVFGGDLGDGPAIAGVGAL